VEGPCRAQGLATGPRTPRASWRYSTLLHRSPSQQCLTWARGGAIGGKGLSPPPTPREGGGEAVQGWPWPRAPQRRRHGGVGPHTCRPFMTTVPSSPAIIRYPSFCPLIYLPLPSILVDYFAEAHWRRATEHTGCVLEFCFFPRKGLFLFCHSKKKFSFAQMSKSFSESIVARFG